MAEQDGNRWGGMRSPEETRALFERWGWSMKAEPRPGEIADRIADLQRSMQDAIDSGELKILRAKLAELDSLRASLDAWSFLRPSDISELSASSRGAA